MSILDHLLGKHLATAEEQHQKVGPFAGLPMLGLDGLASSAYGPEAAATMLLPLGLLGVQYVVPVTVSIVVLLLVVYFSYRQTISAYPNGGGSYTVAKENLGTFAGLLAASALMLDYILVVAVGISAGVGALISAVPILQPFTLVLCLVILLFITMVNLRGTKESGIAFVLPTYLFVFSLMAVLLLGLVKTIIFGGHPLPMVFLPKAAASPTLLGGISIWLLMKAFASGCTAMTGVEAVSNGTKVFREPIVKNAKATLSLIVFILMALLLGIAFLAKAYGVVATEPGAAGYESIISQLTAAIVGRGYTYFITMGAVISVLALSANTGFADFPRMCQIIARDNYMPHVFAERGRRLVFSYGIISIALLSALLLIFFQGITDNLIPLFAIGAFLAFTLSQAGMVVHWFKQKDKNWLAIIVNAFGGLATFITLLVVLISKFQEGGWIITVLVPALLFFFYGVRRHYLGVAKQVSCRLPMEYEKMRSPIVIVPVRGWSKITRKAIQFSMNLTDEVYGVHVETDGDPNFIEAQWEKYVREPAIASGVKAPILVRLPNPYRKLFGSLIDFIDSLEKNQPHRQVAVVIPDLVEHRWYHYFLHNQRAVLLRAALRLHADPRIVIITVPWYLDL